MSEVRSPGAGVPGYAWQRTDAGRAASRRPKQTNDCTVRAVAVACGLAYGLLADAGRVSGRRMTGFPEWLAHQGWAIKHGFPAVKGRRRMTVAAFVAAYPRGRFIVRVAKHVFAAIDGVVYDDIAPRRDRCVYTVWEVSP